MNRKAVPKQVRESVLKEFNHRCAICGAGKPQIHHIDQNSSNNEISNLLPLCPNCHLLDQHDPTTRINSKKLQLFRRFKDPAILSPQFEPLFRRGSFLLSLDQASFNAEETTAKAEELVAFVSALEMGQFYGQKIERLVEKPVSGGHWGINTTESEFEKLRTEESEEYFKKLCECRDDAISLVVELLRYQSWSASSKNKEN